MPRPALHDEPPVRLTNPVSGVLPGRYSPGMDHDVLGQTFALLAAFTWAMALVLFKRSGEYVSPLPLNLFKSSVALVLLFATLLAMGDGLDTLRAYPQEDLILLMFSGLVGIALADTLFFKALNLIGVGLISIVDCIYSPLVILFSFILLSEELNAYHYTGAALILIGILFSSRHAPPANRTRAQIALGMFMTAVAIAMMAFGIVIAKPVLDVNEFPLIWAATLRIFSGTVVLMVLAVVSSQRKEYWAVFRPSGAWKFTVSASILGNYLAMIFWIAGFKYTKASVAGVLNQTSVIFAMVLATVVLKEEFTRRKLISIVLALGGVLIITPKGQELVERLVKLAI